MVDFGFRRIGLAVGETEFGIANTRPTIEATGTLQKDAVNLTAIARKEEAEAIVLGLPVEESGNEGKMARIARMLAGHMSDLGATVHLVDEGLTSVLAESAMKDQGLKLSERDKKRDGEAARLIFERFVNGETTL